ncbi:MAG: T9SS type A sorting domain-containing protein [Cyclobacteriaceae bacterium]
MSDSTTGDLLFYSEGKQVWDRTHTIMANGDSLAGNNHTFIQSSLIVPTVGQADQYYLFTSEMMGEYQIGGLDVFSLHYSVVDMRRNNGLGEVSMKNQQLFDSLGRTITAIPFADQEGYWLIATKTEDEHCFVVWPITSDGIGIPKNQCTGLGPINTAFSINGRMKPSPDGQMLALTRWQFESAPFYLFRFNDTTGAVADPLVVSNLSAQNGLSFSPDSKQLYLSAYDSTSLTENQSSQRHVVHQFAVNDYDSVAISQSLTATSIRDFNSVTDLQLGLDGQLYGITRTPSDGEAHSTFLAVIQEPNMANFDSPIQVRSLEDRREEYTHFPNFMQHYFQQERIQVPTVPGDGEGNDPCDPSLAIRLFPNPTTTQINISVREGCFNSYVLRIIAATGQVLGKSLAIDDTETTVAIPSLAAGVYLAELRFSDRAVVKKFIVR